MQKLLMSIHPMYAEKILRREKRYEYRKTKCTKTVHSILIYETAPIKKVVAEVELINVIVAAPEEIWEKTKSAAGIEKELFDQYYRKTKTAVAYALGEVTVFDAPKALSTYGVISPPQSFLYIDSFNGC